MTVKLQETYVYVFVEFNYIRARAAAPPSSTQLSPANGCEILTAQLDDADLWPCRGDAAAVVAQRLPRLERHSTFLKIS
jgi:hypothetical protein